MRRWLSNKDVAKGIERFLGIGSDRWSAAFVLAFKLALVSTVPARTSGNTLRKVGSNAPIWEDTVHLKTKPKPPDQPSLLRPGWRHHACGCA